MTEYPWGRVSYWRRGAACQEQDEWDRADVFVNPHTGSTRLRYSSRTALSALVHGLSKAHESGKRARSREIMELLRDTR